MKTSDKILLGTSVYLALGLFSAFILALLVLVVDSTWALWEGKGDRVVFVMDQRDAFWFNSYNTNNLTDDEPGEVHIEASSVVKSFTIDCKAWMFGSDTHIESFPSGNLFLASGEISIRSVCTTDGDHLQVVVTSLPGHRVYIEKAMNNVTGVFPDMIHFALIPAAVIGLIAAIAAVITTK